MRSRTAGSASSGVRPPRRSNSARRKPWTCVQRAPAQAQRRDRRHLGLGELPEESMLLENLLVAPAAGAVELGDERRRRGREPGRAAQVLLDADLEYAVLVAVERQHLAGAAPAAGAAAQGLVDRVEDHVRGQALERFGGGGGGEDLLLHGARIACGCHHPARAIMVEALGAGARRRPAGRPGQLRR